MTTTADKIRALEPQAVPIPEETAWAVGVNHGHSVGWKHGIEAAAALVEAEPPQAVRVKPLVWDAVEQDRGDGSSDLTGDWVAHTPFGSYSIVVGFGSDGYIFDLYYGEMDCISSHDDPDLAKAAGQADFSKRCRDCLPLTPTAADASSAPDPVSKTPTLDAMAMRREASRLVRNAGHSLHVEIDCITLPDDAALAEAMQLPEVKALVEAAESVIRDFHGDNAIGVAHLTKLRAALKGVK